MQLPSGVIFQGAPVPHLILRGIDSDIRGDSNPGNTGSVYVGVCDCIKVEHKPISCDAICIHT